MKLKSIQLKGYKSINVDNGASLELGDVTVLLGANGVGKSNLVSFFTMLNYMTTRSFQNYIAEGGYANSFLYFGKQTRQIQAVITFTNDLADTYTYKFTLTRSAGDILIFTNEILTYQITGTNTPYTIALNSGVKESDLLEFVKREDIKPLDKQIAVFIVNMLKNCRVFHFHDTSFQSKIRGQGYIEDNESLNSDASNLAAFLYRLKNNPLTQIYYDKIVRYIQKAMPQFHDFDLRPSHIKNYILLNWRDKSNTQHLFGAHQISDGSLRFMSLATLLLQPIALLPHVIVLDEPELGLHPSAIAYLSGMIKSASKHAQIIIATQSQRLVDEFELDNIVIVERSRTTNSTSFQYKSPEGLSNWLEEYSLSELWEKNVIGGQP